ncbi:MAG: HDOD domain-containing protein, partial [Candidatus Zixiibacteriota bacterium]
LHDIGILVLEKSFPEKFKSIWDKTEGGESLIELEENVWNTNHARVGQFLLEQWNIPSVICEAVGQHHNSYPPETYESEYCLPQIVVLGSRIAKFTTAKVKPDISLDIGSKEIIRNNLKLPPDRLKSIEEKLFCLTVEEAKFLEIDIGSTEDILLEANQLLYQHYLTVENLLRENSKMQQDIAKSKMEKVSVDTL